MSAREVRDLVVIVTGGAQGIGYQIADKLLVEGARVVVIVDVHSDTARVSGQLGQTHGQDRVAHYMLDVCGHSDVERVFREVVVSHGRVDVLVTSAGIVDEREVGWRTCLDVNLGALMTWALEGHQLMRHQDGGGTIINIASILAFKLNPYCPVYQATKFGVLGFSKSLGHKVNYEQYGVRVMAVCPGYTNTNMVVNPKIFPDQSRVPQLQKSIEDISFMDAAVVGKTVVEVFRTADSGTAWVIEEDKPVYQI